MERLLPMIISHNQALKTKFRYFSLVFVAFQAYVATIGDRIVGSVSCQIFAGLYPMPFQPDFRKYGYIWNVYVEPDYRRRGIATKLTKRAIAYLHSLNCTHAILHASVYGKPVYEKLGFVPKNEMILELN